MKNVTVILDTRECFIDLTHRDADPGSWIVGRWKKFLWFKKKISSDWFNDKHQAVAFASEMKMRQVGEPVSYLYNKTEGSQHETN
jgi:hypothetical protein